MKSVARLRDCLNSQQKQLQKLEKVILELESSDAVRENEALRAQAGQSAEACALAQEQLGVLTQENRLLKERLFEQMYAQRSTLLNGAKRQTDILFERDEAAVTNQLSAFNRDIRQRISALRTQLSGINDLKIANLLAQLDRIEAETREFMRTASIASRDGFGETHAAANTGYRQMDAQPFTHEQVERKLKDNSLELRVGGRFTNVLGLVFILLAVIFGLRYTFASEAISNGIKGMAAYLIGAAFLAAGEILNRRRKNYFSLGLCAGGVGVLFASTAVAYFNLGILPKLAAVAICMAVTLVALFLSYRYDAQIIAIFALVGGYLPMTALDSSAVMVFSAMLYFLLLSVFVLFVALKKNWRTIKFFCLFFSAFGTGYLLTVQHFKPVGPNVVYVLANFLLYTAIVLVYPIVRKQLLRTGDTVLLGFNTIFSCGYVFWLLNANDLSVWNGPLALIFCVLFFGFALGIKYAVEEDAGARGLFYATSFAFWVLAVPLQFDASLITLGWLFEGVALSIFGIISGRKWYRRAGYGISAACLAYFLLYDVFLYLSDWLESYLFVWKFSMIVLGAVLILGALLYKANIQNQGLKPVENVFKCFALIGVWVYLVWISGYLFRDVLDGRLYGYNWFWSSLCVCIFTLGCAVLFRAIVPLRDEAMSVISTLLYVFGFLLIYAFNARATWIHEKYITAGLERTSLTACIVLIIFDLAAVYAMFHFVRVLQKPRHSVEWRPLIAGVYSLTLIIQVLMVQFRFSFRNMSVSFILIGWAMAMIVFGFIKRYSNMRRFGLVLSMLSIGKLFLFDVQMLRDGQLIISCALTGMICLVISYLYQMFSRKLLPVTAEDPASEQE